jgi:hypothetical protein
LESQKLKPRLRVIRKPGETIIMLSSFQFNSNFKVKTLFLSILF